MRDHRQRGGENELALARNHIHQRGRGAFVRHMHDPHAGHTVEQLRRQMRRGAHARAGVVQLARTRLGERDELLDVMHRQRGIHHQYVRLRAHQRNRRKVFNRIKAKMFVETGVRAEGGVVTRHQRVAVRRRFGSYFSADIAAGARTIFHDHRLAHALGELLADQACEDIRGPARQVRRDEAQWLHRIILRARRGACQCQRSRSDSTNSAQRDCHSRSFACIANELRSITNFRSTPYFCPRRG